MAKFKDKVIIYKKSGKGASVDFQIQSLIRCKECIYYSYDPEFRSYECSHKKGLMECDPESWCSYAEEIQK